MKISAAALLAVAATSVSAYTHSGTVYVYENTLAHPKTTFIKQGSGNQILTDGAACKGAATLPGIKGAIKATFITVDNQWGFNTETHDNEFWMGYVRINGTNKCLSLTKEHGLTAEDCPPLTVEIKVGNKFAWYRDKRGSSMWAYSGDAEADLDKGIIVAGSNLQTTGKALAYSELHDNTEQNVFIGIGGVNMGDTGKSPTGCQ
ncbi:hypothetical protein BC940DRAFT_329676 [Gongronella butleri]|nr:hypothetical protein BC940DRAFT_329676 [Gongronella butleri]